MSRLLIVRDAGATPGGVGLPFALTKAMHLLTPVQIDLVFNVTDSLELTRNAIIVPLAAAEVGDETVLPDGNLLIRAPFGAQFELWLKGLHRRLLKADLSRTPRADQGERALQNPPD